LESAKELLKNNAPLDIKDAQKKTALHWAAMGGHTEVVKELIQMGAKKDEQDDTGKTPLHLAAMEGHKDAGTHRTTHTLHSHNSQRGG
jgi:ankyrin repeat protein